MSENKSTSNGIGFTGLLLIAFIVLKLCNVITWSWWWVLSPAWITAGIAIVLIAVIGILESMSNRSLKRQSRKYKKAAGELKNAIDEAQRVANESASKWQQRLDEMRAAKDRKRNQDALDETMKNKANEFRGNNTL